MNSNYYWQKHQANERIQARLNEAEIHRSLKGNNKEGKHLFSLLRSLVLLRASDIAALIRWLSTNLVKPKKEKNQMKRKKRFTLLSLLLILGLILVACGGQESEEETPVSDKTTAEEEVADDPNTPPLDAELAGGWVRPTDGMTMVYVPEGFFHMGRKGGFNNEAPVHEVSQNAFWIGGTEVTNEQYALCVNDGSCEMSEYADDSDYNGDNYPVVGVSWFAAAAYCEWADARLPTESEWEYAARGPEGLTYPWGSNFSGEKVNSCDTNCPHNVRDERNDDGYKFTAPAGNYPAGESWVGALDMGGNVSEWVKDWYDEAYYINSSASNPQGPDSGETKVLRGGSWSNSASDLRGTSRDDANPNDRVDNVGFRCVIAPGK